MELLLGAFDQERIWDAARCWEARARPWRRGRYIEMESGKGEEESTKKVSFECLCAKEATRKRGRKKKKDNSVL